MMMVSTKIFSHQIHLNFRRNFAAKVKKINPLKKITPKIEDEAKFLANKGFLRSQKEYSPPADVPVKLAQICSQTLGSDANSDSILEDTTKKFAFLTACEKEFDHAVPNSLLHTMESVKDVLAFYVTPKNANVPLDMMKNIDLPENVHIQYDYHRFHPDTDSKFNGVTAFPRSSTLVTGLKYKEKYQGYETRQSWPHNT